MKTRLLLVALLAVAAWLALPSVAAAAAPVEVTFRFNDAEHKELRAALDVFEKQNPNIKVTLQRIAWGDAREQFLREAAVGQGPDIVHLGQVMVRSMGQAGVFLKLNDLVKKHGLAERWPSDFLSTDLASQDDGTIHAIPWTVDTFAMVYNRDLLKQAGIARFPETWEELRQANRQMKAKTGKVGWGFPAGSGSTNSIWFFCNFYWWSHGWALVDRAPDGKYAMNITVDQIAEAFDYYNSHFKEGLNDKAMLAVTNWGAQELIEGMVQGNIAIISTPEFVLTQIEEAYRARYPGKPLPFASTIHPRDRNGSKTFIGGRTLSVNVNARHPDETFQVIKYLITPEIYTKYYVGQWPAQKSLLAKIERPASHAGYAEQLKHARTWGPYSSGPVAIPIMWNAVGRAAGSVFTGEKTSRAAAKELSDLIQAELAKAR
ncbi:MAG TPA: extracellular solute-binding protein [Methylomirabilota bacterium]|jgi:multiple sugar transport system substrate-binding protein|nr:extracellular solute-binding protein [Methylomirabilota bacterium]